MNRLLLSFIVIFFNMGGGEMTFAQDPNSVPISAPIDTDSAGKIGDVALHAVVRLICVEQNSVGTGFLHKSGNIITADHVVRGCKNPQRVLPTGTLSPVALVAGDQELDLAIVKPALAMAVKPLTLADNRDFKIGTQVSTWGFPGGYLGLSPMLSVGYLAGIDATRFPSGRIVRQWVVNAAFNGGNSGGPLIHVETGEVFGVVSSKLAPISRETSEILKILEQQKFGMQYTGKKPDGTDVSYSEAQLVAAVLNELRRQVQLVIGKAVLREDIVALLQANNIEP